LVERALLFLLGIFVGRARVERDLQPRDRPYSVLVQRLQVPV